jgi:hypothetical protein
MKPKLVKTVKKSSKTVALLNSKVCQSNNQSPVKKRISDMAILKKQIKNTNDKSKVFSLSQSYNDLTIMKKYPQTTKVSSNNLNNIRSQRTIRISNNSINNNTNEMIRNNSLAPFPKVDPEFYTDKHDYFWNKELQKANTMKTILFRPVSERRFSERNFSTFQKVNFFLIQSQKFFPKKVT